MLQQNKWKWKWSLVVALVKINHGRRRYNSRCLVLNSALLHCSPPFLLYHSRSSHQSTWQHLVCLACARFMPLLTTCAASSMLSSLRCCSRVSSPWWASSCCLWAPSSCWLVRCTSRYIECLLPYLLLSVCEELIRSSPALDHQLPKVYFPQVKSLHGLVVSTLCWTPLMRRTTFPSSPLSLSISPQPGPHTTLTFSCWSSCSQASAHSAETHSKKRFILWWSTQLSVSLLRLWLTVTFPLLTVGLYYCFNNLSDARIFIIMYGVTSMYFSAVMVCPV